MLNKIEDLLIWALLYCVLAPIIVVVCISLELFVVYALRKPLEFAYGDYK